MQSCASESPSPVRVTLNILIHGGVRLPAFAAFAQGTARQFADAPLPAGRRAPFGLVLLLLGTATESIRKRHRAVSTPAMLVAVPR